MLRTRVATTAIVAPVIVVVALLGEPWLSVLLVLVAVLAAAELFSMLDAGGFEPPRALGISLAVAVVGAGLLTANADNLGGFASQVLDGADPPGLLVVAGVAAMLVLAAAAFGRPDPRTGFVAWALSSFGVGYVGLLAAIALVGQLHPAGESAATGVGWLGLASGPAWTLLLLLVVWSYDSGAYFVGRRWGSRRLAERISPSKTVEGMAGGLLVAMLAAGIGSLLVGVEAWHALLIGPIVGLAAQAGDLAESMLKRAAGRKESGVLFPGHGGVLDRIDSFLFAAPVLACYAVLVAGQTL